MGNDQKSAMDFLRQNKGKLTWQQYKTIKGQIRSGDTDGAMRGLQRVLARNARRKEGEAYAT